MKRTGLKLALMLSLAAAFSTTAFADNLGPAYKDGQQIKMNNEAIIRTAEQQETEAAKAEPEKEEADDEQEDTGHQRLSFSEGETPFGTVLTEESKLYKRGESLGEFKIVAYYGDGKTYSGTTPAENRTIAADLSVLPLGTKVFIGETVYTVEDKGSGVKGNMIDIYYNTKEEAVGVTRKGRKFAEVYAAVAK